MFYMEPQDWVPQADLSQEHGVADSTLNKPAEKYLLAAWLCELFIVKVIPKWQLTINQ